MTQIARIAMLAVVGVGCAGFVLAAPADDKKAKVEFRRAETKPAEGLTEATVVGTTDKVYLHKTADLTSADIAEAIADIDARTLDPTIRITLTKEGAKKMEKLSTEHKGRPLAVVVDGKVISAPVIQFTISSMAQITGKFTKAEAEKLARAIGGK